MQLSASCHCGTVRFEVRSLQPCPDNVFRRHRDEAIGEWHERHGLVNG